MELGKRLFKIHSISHFAMILSKSIMVHPSNHPSNHPSIHSKSTPGSPWQFLVQVNSCILLQDYDIIFIGS